jgi:hypothetical protein
VLTRAILVVLAFVMPALALLSSGVRNGLGAARPRPYPHSALCAASTGRPDHNCRLDRRPPRVIPDNRFDTDTRSSSTSRARACRSRSGRM